MKFNDPNQDDCFDENDAPDMPTVTPSQLKDLPDEEIEDAIKYTIFLYANAALVRGFWKGLAVGAFGSLITVLAVLGAIKLFF